MRVGVFDSGLGGLSVWREIAGQWPRIATVYVADQLHIPYGARPAGEIRDFARGITRFLLDQRCEAIVVACNTASAAALVPLRTEWPHVPFVGMEPAVKPAVAVSRTRVAGVLATPATLQGALFATALERFAADVRIVRQVCPGLVERIEAGDVSGAETRDMLRAFLAPSLAADADTIVLACTHYPFVRPVIEDLVGPSVTVIDPALAVARQVARVVGGEVAERGLGDGQSAPGLETTRHATFFTTGDPARFDAVGSQLLGIAVRSARLFWNSNAKGETELQTE